MKKILKMYGTSLVINFSRSEKEIWDLKEGDVIDIEINKPINWVRQNAFLKEKEIEEKDVKQNERR